MLEHSTMYLNVTPPYEEDTSFFPEFYNTRVGPCELQDPVWAKMNALTGIKQKRKKLENKPQTQINKCNNEKRRREQENIYIEELAELISANFADMSSLSVKPDKCAILQETVNQIRRIKQQDNNPQLAIDPVQQGEVSSSRPTILSNEVYGPLLLEALEGFLFVIDSEGKVEHVTENVSNYIRFTKEEIIGKSIYNFLHLGDHKNFHSNLLPMTFEWGENDQPPPSRSKSIDVRLLVKPEDFDNETVEEKNQRVPCYELMHISSTQLRDHLSVSEEDGSDSGPCVLCVASRISHREKATCFFQQFTTKLDTSGKIICVDASGVSEPVSQTLRKEFKARALRDLVPAQDLPKLSAHLKEVLSTGTSVSPVYRIQVGPDTLVTVQTKSKLFKNYQAPSDSDFIMATHSIIEDKETLDPGGGIGDPLMTSIVNGAGTPSRNGPLAISEAPPSSSASTGTMMQSSSSGGPFTPEFLDNDFPSLDFPSTTWDLEPAWHDTARPNSRQSLTPVSTPTPRPPSNPSYSNAPTVVQSPMAHYSTQPSPATSQGQQQNQPSTPYMSYGIMDDFQEQSVYSVDDQKDNKPMEEMPSHPEPQRLERLRSLLTNPPTSTASGSSGSSSGSSTSAQKPQDDTRDRILKELLNQQDDDQGGRLESRNSRILINRVSLTEPPKTTASSSTGNDMLRMLLNEKNDDDIEAKAGMKKSRELLQELLKKGSEVDDEKKNENNPHEDALFRNLGFPSASPGDDRRGSKRSIDEKDERDSKRSNNGSQVSSSGSSEKSEIYQKNKMLASLLENPTPTPPSIPPIPASVISATPQEKLPRVITDPAKMISGSMGQNGRHNTSRMGRQQSIHSYHNDNNNFHNQRGIPNNMYNNQSTSTTDNTCSVWENNNNKGMTADPDLSDILDTVLDFVPDGNALLQLDSNEGQHSSNCSQLSEMAAIKTIQDSLMLCEKAVPSPNVSLPARPPAYNANLSSQNNLGYPPPPNYPPMKYPRSIGGNRSGNVPPQYVGNVNAQQLLIEQQRKLQKVEEQKRRLLQQQKQQQLLIPSNVTAAEISSIQNIDNLLNNTVAPNVTLQRSNSVPESQLSPNFATGQLQGSNSMNQTNQRGAHQQPNQTQPYSPHSQMQSPLGQQSFQTPNAPSGPYNQQRLSPQAQFNSQLSPRQTYTTQVSSGGGGGGASWAQQQQQQRLTVQNPMLNAQLTGALTGRGNFQRPTGQQQQAAAQAQQRHSPFGGGADQFTAPASPTAFNHQSQYLRLQRANSVPNSATQMPGGLGSPRSYPNQAPPHYPTNPLQSIPPSSMMYPNQQDASPYNCYEPQPQQPTLTGYERRASAPSAQQHLQPGVAGNNPTSEFVRQELRAVVGARTAQAQPATSQRSLSTAAQQLQQQLGQADLESLGITFEMPSGASDSPKLWGAMGSDMGSMSPPQPATSRNSMEEGRAGDHTKTSLLQQLLSDQSK